MTLIDETLGFTFAIDGIPVRFYRGQADDPTPRTLRRQTIEAEQLSMKLGQEQAEGLVFRFALEATADGNVDRVVFLALRGEEGRVECLWPVPLEKQAEASPEPRQLQLLGEDANGVTLTIARRPASADRRSRARPDEPK